MEIKKILQSLSIVFVAVLFTACASTETSDSEDVFDGDYDSAAAASGIGAAGAITGGTGDSSYDSGTAGYENVFYFEFDQATLTAETRAALDAHIARLASTTEAIRLEGHADERGSREYNIALGERRANTVANYMVINGIDRARIETVSYGEERPVSFGQDEMAWSKNRRVELK